MVKPDIARPSWNHPEVKTRAAEYILKDVRAWTDAMSFTNSETDDREFFALLVLALQESVDAYSAGRYIEEFLNWPVTGELVRILDTAFLRMPYLTERTVAEWVLSEGIRFPAKKGEGVSFYVGDTSLSGKVEEVNNKEAVGYVTPINAKRTIRVNAEDVIDVFSLTGPRTKGPPNSGGTPVASRGGAILAERVA